MGDVTSDAVLDTEQFKDIVGSINIDDFNKQCGIKTRLHTGQKDMADLFTKENRKHWNVAVICASRRIGKSFFIRQQAKVELMYPNASVAIISANSTKLAKDHLDSIYADFMSHPILKKEVHYSKADGTLKIPRLNSTLVVASSNNYTASLVGRAFSVLIFDEAGLISPINLLKEMVDILSPTLLTYKQYDDTKCNVGKIVLVSTPRGVQMQTPFGKHAYKGEVKQDKHITIKKTIYDNPFLTKDQIENLKKNTPEDVWNQEYMVKFGENNTSVLHRFDAHRHIKKIDKKWLKENNQDLTLITSSDYGIVDGAGILICLYHNPSGVYYFIEEFYTKDMIISEFIEKIISMEEKVKKQYDIPTKNCCSYTDPSRCKEMAIEAKKKYGYNIQRGLNSRDLGFDTLNQLLQTDKIVLDETLNTTIDHWAMVTFKETSQGISNQYERSGINHHGEMIDCGRYCVATNEQMNRKVGVLVI